MIERNEEFDEVLDESYPTVVIGEGEYFISDILYSTDPINYNEMKLDWEDCYKKMEED